MAEFKIRKITTAPRVSLVFILPVIPRIFLPVLTECARIFFSPTIAVYTIPRI